MKNISLAPWPSFTEEEKDAVADLLISNRVNYWTGTEGRLFENEFAAWNGVKHSIALMNGTVALDLALKGLKIGAANGGATTDEVIVTPRTFIASASTVVNAGATPVFADVDPDSGNISVASIEAVLTECTKAVIPVHLAGWPCEMDGLMSLAETYQLKIIEDCAQAHGAKYRNRQVGSIGHVGAWSFCQDKIMTTGGEGGMVTCDDDELWSRMWSFKDHGKSWDAVFKQSHPPGYRWVHNNIGTNWRMLEMQAVIGRIQLRRMSNWTELRTERAQRIRDALLNFETVRVPQPAPGITHAYYRLYAYIRPEKLRAGWTRDRIVQECAGRGAPVFQGSCSEVYLEKAFEGTPWRSSCSLPVAQELGKTSLAFLVHPTITEEQMEQYCAKICSVLSKASA